MPNAVEIRRRPNGAIDTDHYAQLAGNERRVAVFKAFRALHASLATLLQLSRPAVYGADPVDGISSGPELRRR